VTPTKTFIIQASLMIVTYDRKNIFFIIQAPGHKQRFKYPTRGGGGVSPFFLCLRKPLDCGWDTSPARKHSWLLCDTVEDQLVDYFRVKRPNVVYLSVCDNVLESFC
jgi:hypothetical protein